MLSVEAAGLYELTMAFFAKKRRAVVRVMVNEECVCRKDMDENEGSIVKKVCGIEFVVLPAKARVVVVFECMENG